MRTNATGAAKYWAKRKRTDSSKNVGTQNLLENAQQKSGSYRQKLDKQFLVVHVIVLICEFRQLTSSSTTTANMRKPRRPTRARLTVG
jgi:hypothetical protein